MKIKTAELIGPALDWAVAKCEGLSPTATHIFNSTWPDGLELEFYNPSTDWAHGGPIIEREGISVRLWIDDGWCAYNEPEGSEADGEDYVGCSGPTPLISAMRCYIACKLGNEVEVPEELA